jgi:hypothetical protein
MAGIKVTFAIAIGGAGVTFLCSLFSLHRSWRKLQSEPLSGIAAA